MLTVSKDSYKGHAKSPWLVVVPRRLSPTGKRQYKRFSTRSAAQTFCASVRCKVRAEGEQPLAVVAAQLAADATAALKLLEGSGLSLLEAVRQGIAASAPQTVAFECHLQSGGAGAEKRPDATGAPLTIKAALATMESAKNHQAQHTRAHRASMFRTLFARVPTLANTLLTTCTAATLRAALDTAWPHAPTCWNSGRRLLHSLFAHAIKHSDLHIQNPVARIEFQRIQEREITALPPAGLQALFDACRPANAEEKAEAAAMSHFGDRAAAATDMSDLRLYIALCAFAGVRPTECSRLRWHDIDLEDGIISVRAINAKTGGTRHIQMHPALHAWLTACRPAAAAPDDFITPPSRLHRRLFFLRSRAGFGADNPWQADILRHSYATYYLKAQCGNIHQLQLNMGHRDAHLLYTRYTNMRGVNRAMAESWWQILP